MYVSKYRISKDAKKENDAREKQNKFKNKFKNGQLVKLSGGRTGIIIKKYNNFYRVKITAGENAYNECFCEEEISL